MPRGRTKSPARRAPPRTLPARILARCAASLAAFGVGPHGAPDRVERQRAAAPLASEQLYRTLAAHFPRGAIVLFDHDLRFTVAEGAGLASVGLSPEQLVGKTLGDVVPRAISARLEPCCHAALAGDETRVEVAFGRNIYAVTTLPVRDDDGVVVAGMLLTVDATERLQVARQLRDAEERYRRLVEQMPAITYTSALGDDAATLYISPQCAQWLGYSPEEWLATPDIWFNTLHPDDRERVRAAIARSNVELLPWTLEYRCVARDGRIIWLRDEAVLVRDAVGRPLHWHGVALDITEHQEAEARLRASEDSFRSAFNHAGIGMALSAPDGRFERVNAALCAFLGYSEAELMTLTLRDISHPADYGLRLADRERLLAGELQVMQFEKRYLHKDGRTLWGAVSASLVRDADGAPLHTISQVQDITERKHMEEQLREAEDRFRTLVEQMPAVTFIETPEATGSAAYMSPQIEAILGFPPETFQSNPDLWWERVHPDDRAHVLAEIERTNSTREPYSAEFRIYARDGREVWLQNDATLRCDADGEPLYWQGVMLDITDRKRAEQALRQREQELHDLAANTPDALIRYDRAQRMIYLNPVAARLYQLPREELLGKTAAEITGDTEFATLWMQHLAEVLASGEAREVELRSSPAVGSLWLHAQLMPERDAGGALASVLAVIRDITDRKRAEDALRLSEERYRSAFDDAAIGMAIYDFTGQFIRVNPALCRMLRLSEAALLERSFDSILHPEDALIQQEQLIEVFAGERLMFQTERRMLRADGATVYTLLSISVIRGADGLPQYLVAQAQDITDRALAEDALRASEERFRSAFDDAGIGMSISRLDGRWVRVNAPLVAMLGYTQEELLSGGAAFWQITHPDDIERQRAHIAALLAGETRTFEMEKRYIRKDGEILHAMLNVSTLTNGAGDPLYLVAQTQDITARKRAEEALRESEQRFRSVFESPALGIAVNALDGTWLQVNEALCALLGYTEAELRQTTFQALTHPDDLARNAANERDLLSGASSAYQTEKRYLHKSGREVWTQLNVSIVRNSQEQPLYYVAQIHDISQRKAAEEQLQRQARFDSLTQLPNRAMFMERLEHALTRSQRSGEQVGVLFIDLDGFKAVNDTLGHAAGDRLLAEVAARLQLCVRASDTVARLGGDEFTVLIDGLPDPDLAANVARRMIAAVSQPYDLDGVPAHVGASIGISSGGPPTTDPARLMLEADTALYQAKARGKRQSVLYDDLRAELDGRAPTPLPCAAPEPERTPISLASRRGSSGR
jgi:diguanylate cyclase (GGDEF)-like protein/PAS domain S-box-containing protein